MSIIRKANIFLNEKPWLVFIFFTLLVIVLRWVSFYVSVIDWDESLYLLVSNAWLEGNPPYTTIWDNKPPGIYAIFLIAISIFGHSVLSIRIISCLFIACTCFFLYKIGSLIERNGRGIGLLSGCLYATATLSNGGIASNTEIFFTTFVVFSFYLFFKNFQNLQNTNLFPKHLLTLFLIGFLLGIGFEIKYVAVFDFIALSLILIATFILQVRSNKKYWSILQAISLMSLGFILPFIIVSIYFWLIGHFDDYIYANFTANKLRTIDLKFSFSIIFKAISEQIQKDSIFWLSVPSTIIYLFIAKTIPTRERSIVSGFIVLFFIDLFCILIVFRGSFFTHYFLQLSLSLSFLTAYIVITLVFSSARIEKPRLRQYLILGAILIFIFNITGMFGTLISNARYVYFRHAKGIYVKDAPMMIAEYLKTRIKPDSYIYLVNKAPIVYFLSNGKIPSRYAFPPFLLECCDLPNITGIDRLKELDLILQKQPAYIIIKLQNDKIPVYSKDNKLFFDKLNQALNKSYHLEKTIYNYVLYRSNSSSLSEK